MATKKTTTKKVAKKKVAKFATKANIAKIEKEGYLVLTDAVAGEYNANVDNLTAQIKESERVSGARLQTSQNQAKHIEELQGTIKGLRSDVKFFRVMAWVAVIVLIATALI